MASLTVFGRPRRARLAGASGAARVMVAALAALGAMSVDALAAEMCWSPADLRHRAGEERVVQGTERALVSVPAVAPGAQMKSPFAWRGILRRVDLPPGQNLVALTFDMCEQPHEVAGYQGDIVDLLRDQRVKATFFLGGKWMLTHQQRAQQLIADPLFEVGNHAWEHRNLRLLVGSSALDDEIIRPQLAYRQVRGQLERRMCVAPGSTATAYKHGPDNITLFRFPFGACNPKSLEAVEALGLRAIQWDVSSSDPWMGQTAAKMVHDVVSRVKPGSIVLFHANGRGRHTGSALPAIVEALRAKGFRFVTVSELLRTPGAKPVLSQECYDARPGDSNRYDTLARNLAVQHDRIVKRLVEQRAARSVVPAAAPAAAAPRGPPAAPAPPAAAPTAPAPVTDVKPRGSRAPAPRWESSIMPETYSPK